MSEDEEGFNNDMDSLNIETGDNKSIVTDQLKLGNLLKRRKVIKSTKK